MQSNENYPTKKVILSYALLGGAIGGILIALGLIPTVNAFDTNFLELTKGFIIWIIMGAIIGFSPALITGIIISRKCIRLINLKNYLYIALVGLLTSLPFLFILMVSISNWLNGLKGIHLDFETLLWSLKFSLSGAVSSVIVGKLILPKT